LEKDVRKISFTCGGCCGRAVHRKFVNLKNKAQKCDGIEPSEILVKLASCITQDNYHGPPCPHLEYLKAIIAKTGLAVSLDTALSKKAQERRASGVYEGP
jgi:predicted metal-binding protein